MKTRVGVQLMLLGIVGVLAVVIGLPPPDAVFWVLGSAVLVGGVGCTLVSWDNELE